MKPTRVGSRVRSRVAALLLILIAAAVVVAGIAASIGATGVKPRASSAYGRKRINTPPKSDKKLVSGPATGGATATKSSNPSNAAASGARSTDFGISVGGPTARIPINITIETNPDHVLEGPLCVFVPANSPDDEHGAELKAAMATWFDASTVLFTEKPDVVAMARNSVSVLSRKLVVAHASMEPWNAWQWEQIRSQDILRTRDRGCTRESIQGRGQLSIPLFHWMAQMVKRNDPLVRNCKWFMKCDTDTFLRREAMEAIELSKVASPLAYVGVPYKFDTRPYQMSDRQISFVYNIGGPGYTFSRGLLEAVKSDTCVQSMAMDPVLLIHDDVATGFCARYYAAEDSKVTLSTAHSTASASYTRLLSSVAEKYMDATYGKKVQDTCLYCVTAWHPASPRLMFRLQGLLAAASNHSDPNYVDPGYICGVEDPMECRLTLMVGMGATVGDRWTLDEIHRNVVEFWHVKDVDRDVQPSKRARAKLAKDYMRTVVGK